MTKVAIVILNWNGKDYLEKFLPSVIKYSNFSYTEIYVADNHSRDDSIDFIKSSYPDIRIISFDSNYGFARGYVKALEQIKAEYFVLLNSDVEVTEQWLSIVDIMENDKSVAAVMPKIRSYNDKDHFEYAGAAGGFIDKYGYPFCRGRILNVIEKDEGQYNDQKEIFWASGACMFVRSEAYFEAGGLDRDFFAHMEEIDLCWRLKILGYKIICSPGATVFHVGGGTLPNNTGRKLYLNYRNNLFLLYKNLSDNGFYKTILIRLFLDVLSAFAYLLSLSFNFFAAVFMAHFSFYSSLKTLRKKRQEIKRNIRVSIPSQIYKGSIVYDFFMRKKRYFSSLKIQSFK
jgi:GT2 family glycosyltransferase